MDRNDAPPPTPAGLRERSRGYREVARKAVDPVAKRETAAYAFALAQVAEAMERAPALATTQSYKRLLEQALERTRTIVEEVSRKMGRPAPNPCAQIRAWRMRAEELRTTADGFELPSAQEKLGRAAQDYALLADRTEALLMHRPEKPSDKAG